MNLLPPAALWPDNHGTHINAHGGGVLHHRGRYYWFGEHKIEGEAGNFAHVGVHVYSSVDLLAWQDEGIALKVLDNPGSDLAKGCVIERPKVLFNAKTQKFVMWFHWENSTGVYSAARSGVAIADHVTGPYTLLRTHRPDAGTWPLNALPEQRAPLTPEEANYLSSLTLYGGPAPGYPLHTVFRRDFAGGQMARDMTLFQDSDGSGYHIYASEENGCLHISQLTDDYLASSGKWGRYFPGGFNEAPVMIKRDNKYYLISSGCTGWDPNAARSAVADSIWGPWTELGNPCRGKESDLTFGGQSTHAFQLAGTSQWIFMADLWRPKNAIDGRYFWLPLNFENDRPILESFIK